MKVLNLEEEFKLSVETFFTFFFENANFKQKYHSSRGDSQIEVKPWTPTADRRYTREVSFCSFISNNPVINRLVGEKAKVKEVQFYKYIENGSLHVSSETFFDGSSIGKSFSSISEWTVSPISNPLPGCKVVIQVKNNYNGTMFKSVLENWVHDTTEDSFKQWLTLVRQQVEEYEKNEQLKRITPTPVKNKSNNHHTNNNSNFKGGEKIRSKINYIDEDDIDNINDDDDNNNYNNNNNNNNSHNNIVDDNQKSILRQYNNNNNNNVQQNNNNNNVDDFSDSELSDISRRAPSHLDFNDSDEEVSDDEEEEDEEDIEYDERQSQSTNDDKFYDSNDVWPSSSSDDRSIRSKKDIKNFMVNINNDISHLKSIIEVNHNRLFGLEDAFNQIQKSPNNSSTIIATTTTTTNNRSSPSTIGGGSSTMVDSTYLSRLEDCVKNIQDDEIKTREKQKEWIEKIGELERKLNQIGTAQSRSILWINILALIFFLIGWPIVAKKLWKTLSPFLTSLLTKK